MSLISRMLGRLSGRKLDTSWIARIEKQYDIDGGYAAYHEFCREVTDRSSTGGTLELERRGRMHLRAVSEETAREIEREVLERSAPRPSAQKSQHLSIFEIDDPEYERSMLERILSPAVDRAVVDFFDSEYLVYWYHVTRSVPVADLGLNSFRWHCDRGPRSHLKLLLYLNDWNDHGGGTSFLDLEATKAIAQSGYVFAPVNTRVADLGPIARRAGATYAPWFQEMQSGEGILFQPSSVLHRGELSTHGPRHVLTLCLLPSPVPWSDAHARGVPGRSPGDGKWHESAESFRRAFADEG